MALGAGLVPLLAPLCADGRELVFTRLAGEQSAELLVLESGLEDCRTIRVVTWPSLTAMTFAGGRPVTLPFGGAGDEWPALELAAWLSRAHGLPLRLLGRDEREGRRDSSRLLASASLALQRFAGTSAEPVLVPPGPDKILSQPASLLVASLPPGDPGETRRALVERATVPVLLVRGGLRPGGLAP